MLHPVHRIWYLLRSRGEEPNWGKTVYLSHIKLLVGIKVENDAWNIISLC